jgi:hypothetical protein
MRYRIKQVGETIFIPQCKLWWHPYWGNIDLAGDWVWNDTSRHSHCKSLESANTTIKKTQVVFKIKKTIS